MLLIFLLNLDEVQFVIEMDARSFGIIAASNCSQPGTKNYDFNGYFLSLFVAVYDIKQLTMTQVAQYQLQFSGFLLSFHQEPISYLIPVSGNK